MKIRKAIVLAAGLGTRLRPLTFATPKPLMPVWDVPMLERIVAMLREWGAEEIVVNCHYLHEQVEAWCAKNGCTASFEPEILGTGGVLNPLRGWIGEDDFYLVNGDIVVDGAHFPTEEWSEGCIGRCLTTEEGPRTVEVEPESGFVTNWRSDDAGFPGTFTYCGIALLRAKILDYIPPEGFSSVVSAYEKAMMDGWFIKAFRPADMIWTDAGTVTSYIELNQDGEDNAFNSIPQVRKALEESGAPADAKVEFLGARGSERMFFRLGGESIAVIYDDSRRAENALYARQARWLAAKGAPVPALVADMPKEKLTVFEWAGSERKLKLADSIAAVESLAAFNALGDAAVAEGLEMMPAFDSETWKWERDLFCKHCLGSRFGREMPEAVEAELVRIAGILEREPPALVHRDFQSSNILWKNDRPRFIDFQGMRIGPAVYDLASFLYDPYVKLRSERERAALCEVYGKAAGRADISAVLPFAAVERLIQCLGAFGRLVSVGQPQFTKWVLPALENLLAAADEAELEAVGALAEELISAECRSREHHHHHVRECECGCGHSGK